MKEPGKILRLQTGRGGGLSKRHALTEIASDHRKNARDTPISASKHRDPPAGTSSIDWLLQFGGEDKRPPLSPAARSFPARRRSSPEEARWSVS
jgi:hypothetical protein